MMKCICYLYFQDKEGKWYQPGMSCEFNKDEAKELESRGYLKIIETAMLEVPETRIIKFKKRGRRNAG